MWYISIGKRLDARHVNAEDIVAARQVAQIDLLQLLFLKEYSQRAVVVKQRGAHASRQNGIHELILGAQKLSRPVKRRIGHLVHHLRTTNMCGTEE